jgi:hypothetical protein
MFDVLALWLILWVIKNAAMDLMYASSGKPNPRYEAKKAKAAAAGKNPPAQPRYGTRDWFNDLLADGLQAQTEARRRRADKKRKAREEAERKAEEAEQAQAEQQAGEQPGPSEQEPAAQPDPQTSEPGAGGAPDPEQPQQPRPTPPPDGPDAQVIPFPKPNQQEEPPVSTTDINSEVQGLDQSIAYAQSLAKFAGEHGQAGNEGYLSHLTEAKVEGEGLSTAAQMQEAFDDAQAAAEAHATELERQKAVQEAYDANPDAGDKDFQQSGR